MNSSRNDLAWLSAKIYLMINPSQGQTNDIVLKADGKTIVPNIIIEDHDVLQPTPMSSPSAGLLIPNKLNGPLPLGKQDNEKHTFKF
ncbi:hypothetical protein O181_105641 [Austropuccinia psidii MF-1]|uniref:Uncharacterized protein n=1 Tax=Austropuccinia psidii MF-1 TaxID=1389203 RepID=A0A9Q3PMH0_9BASI|nr:hypothetical protein [Austropuccinia psidii MF-1]